MATGARAPERRAPLRLAGSAIATSEVREWQPAEAVEELVDQIGLDTGEVSFLAPAEYEVLAALHLPEEPATPVANRPSVGELEQFANTLAQRLGLADVQRLRTINPLPPQAVERNGWILLLPPAAPLRERKAG
jgi:hypothetical protein